MRIIAFPICAVMIGVGALFLGQGTGYIPGSFMPANFLAKLAFPTCLNIFRICAY